jgi:uncharacterized membrane protein HdeD (DUF308 family)
LGRAHARKEVTMDNLTRDWGWVVLRGVLAILFGVVTLSFPGITLAAFVLLFGAYALADGVGIIAWAIANRHGEPHWIAAILGGLAGIAAGIATFLSPPMTAVALLMLIAAWAIVTGVACIVAAIRLRKVLTGEWLLALAGVLALVFGGTLIAAPGPGALALALWIGAYAVVSGAMLVALGFRLRSWGRKHTLVSAAV